jgi:hypothetical protein
MKVNKSESNYEVPLEKFQQEWLEIVAAIKGKK